MAIETGPLQCAAGVLSENAPAAHALGGRSALGLRGWAAFSFWLGGLFGGTNGVEVDAEWGKIKNEAGRERAAAKFRRIFVFF